MSATKTIRVVRPVVGILIAVGLAAGAARADEPHEIAYKDYYGAIESVVLCDERKFDQPAHAKMAGVIDQKINFDIGAGRRLTLIEQAKSDVYKLVWKKGCTSEPVGRLLGVFHSELEPAL
jgi:hypothetical protein